MASMAFEASMPIAIAGPMAPTAIARATEKSLSIKIIKG
jgi:hypothetical protein